jgi:predicted TPR repeat methyltransferase
LFKSDGTASGHFQTAYSLETNEQTRQHYRSWAATYDQEVAGDNGYAQPRRVAETVSRLAPSHSCRILDAGCGSGLSGLALKEAGFSAIDGCDFSPEMLEKSLEKGCYDTLFEANLNVGMPNIADAAYQIVTCVGVFSFGHVFPDACDELVRILQPGGHLVIALNEQYWNKGDLAAKIAQLETAGTLDMYEKQYGEHLPGHNVKGWVIALEKK